MSLKVLAHGKVNLSLGITGCREDGYHTLHTVMQSVELADILTLCATPGQGLQVTCSVVDLAGEGNLAYKAAEVFCAALQAPCEFHIHIEKYIPIAGGMGGGSADAAGVLFGLNHWFSNPFSLEELCGMALQLGADVPFCLVGGTQLATGIGEVLTVLPNLPPCGMVLIKPCEKESTGAMYAKYDKIKGLSPQENCGIISAIQTKDMKEVALLCQNDFQSLYENPDVAKAITCLMEKGALGACLTGSGPTVFGIFKSHSMAHQVVEELSAHYPVCIATQPVSLGCQVV